MPTDKVLRCDCGFEVRSTDEEELVAAAQLHASRAHAMTLSHDEALVLLLRFELEARTAAGAPPAPTSERRAQ